MRVSAGDGAAGGEDVSIRAVPVLRNCGATLKTRLILPDGSSRALTWTNRHPNQASKAGLVLFRHSPETLSGAEARSLIARGGWIETTHPARIRRALGFADDEAGVVEMEKEA